MTIEEHAARFLDKRGWSCCLCHGNNLHHARTVLCEGQLDSKYDQVFFECLDCGPGGPETVVVLPRAVVGSANFDEALDHALNRALR